MIPIKDTQPSYSTPAVTILLIVANVLIFLNQFWLSIVDPYSMNEFVAQYALRPAYFRVENVVTSMFLHANWMHLIGNMLFLWVFGDNVEDILGHVKYLFFYLLCGAAAAMAQVIIDPSSRVPMVGASGAIAGVMGAYFAKFPHSRVVMLTWFILIFTFEVPAWLMLVYWFGMQLFGGVGSIADTTQQGGTAFFAHIGGFVAGLVVIHLVSTRQRHWRRRDLTW